MQSASENFKIPKLSHLLIVFINSIFFQEVALGCAEGVLSKYIDMENLSEVVRTHEFSKMWNPHDLTLENHSSVKKQPTFCIRTA